ncbi:hypothetical protein AB0F73_23850 [Micromonospora purpureochromogenes]|uniref:hypothetical protein n=1 Tax=Micromonospora purpureochromogenes TaxID=47872 RepID=UPI0033DB9739
MAAVSAGLVAVGAPAQASSGGGCRNTGVVGSCISYSGGSVRSDFYLNASPDSSRCKYKIEIKKPGVSTPIKSTGILTLDHGTGRYGPISQYVLSNPPKSGSAYTLVSIYTCSNVLHFTAQSPTVYYP